MNAPTLRILACTAILLASAFLPAEALAQRAAAARVAPHSATVVAPRAAVVASPSSTATVAVPRGTVVVGGGYPGGYHYGHAHYGYPAYGSFYVGYPWYGGSFGFSVGFGFGYPYAPYYAYPYAVPYGAPYAYPYGYYGYPAPVYYDGSAAMHLQVTPRNTEVYVDGYYAGIVDNFDGTFQRLNIQPGQHDVELYLPGYRTLQRNVYLQPGKTTNIKYAMEPLAPGEPEPVKPSPAPAPSPQLDPSITPSTPSTPSPQRPSGSARRPAPTPARDYPRDTASDGGLTVYKGDPNVALDTHGNDGSLSLRVQPGPATIKIDGEKWEGSQDSDRLVIQLPAGSHVLEVSKDGYHRYTTEVLVRSGQTATLNVALTKN